MRASLSSRLRYIGKLVLFALVTFLIVIEVVGVYRGIVASEALAHPQRNAICCEYPEDAGYAYEPADFSTADGRLLHGWYIPGTNDAAILLAHGANGNRTSLWDLAVVLHEHGYGVLLFDMRAHGTSDGSIFAAGWQDIVSAANYLEEAGVKHIGTYGFSLGADMVIQGAAKRDSIEAVIADGASPVSLAESPRPTNLLSWLFLSYEIAYWTHLEGLTASYGGFGWTSMHDAAARIAPRPLLLIAAGAEPTRYEANVAQGIYDAAGEPKSLWVIDDVRHGGGYSQHYDEYTRRVLEFFDAALLK